MSLDDDNSAVRYSPRWRRPTVGRPRTFPRPPLAPIDMAELAALGSLPLRARRLAEAVGTGGHRSHRRGASVEFADYRDYQAGDDLRRVDWRLFGRTDRVQLRETHEETPLRVLLLLDKSPSMSYASRPGLLTKLDLARATLGALALLTRQQRDACGIGLLGDGLGHYLAPGASPARRRAVWGVLEKPEFAAAAAAAEGTAKGTDGADGVEVTHGGGLARALAGVAEVVPRSTLIVIASDFYEEPGELAAVARRLRFERHDVLALHVIDPAEEEFGFEEPAKFCDLENEGELSLDPATAAQAYRAAFAAQRAALDEAFRGCGFDYLGLRTDAPPLTALAAYLARRAGKG